MSFNRNKNLKIVGFFGQSGSGKTTIIRNVNKKINGHVVMSNTGIIRYLFNKNTNSYLNPEKLVNDNIDIVTDDTNDKRNDMIDDIYEKYIRSQMQLLNDWSTEIYSETVDPYIGPSILLVDRSPIDFYVLTTCGINYLMKHFDKPLNPMCEYLITLNAKIAQDNLNNFFNAVFITKPWNTPDINKLKDGVRDQYLSDYYTGDNWYSKIKDINIENDVQTFVIPEDVIDLKERTNIVNDNLERI